MKMIFKLDLSLFVVLLPCLEAFRFNDLSRQICLEPREIGCASAGIERLEQRISSLLKFTRFGSIKLHQESGQKPFTQNVWDGSVWGPQLELTGALGAPGVPGELSPKLANKPGGSF
jgi:hypothetical protein